MHGTVQFQMESNLHEETHLFNCKRIYMKSKAFLRGGKIASKVVNCLYEKQRFLIHVIAR